jgi:ABC-2 type transport system ATP-binding protein
VSSIDVDGLTKRFGSRSAIEAITFRVDPGDVFGLLGPNGAGKTTTVRVLTGLLFPTVGEATVCGLSVRTDGQALRRKVGLLTENPGLYDRLTARENLQFFIKLYELDPRLAWARAMAFLERFGLQGREDDPCGSYSKGMRQKLSIIRTILHEPEVLFLDEPTSGLDPEAARTVRDAISELAKEGRTIVLCSHNLAEVEQLCSRVALIRTTLLTVSTVKALRQTGLVLEVRLAEQPERFAPLLRSLPFKPSVQVADSQLRVSLRAEEDAADVIGCLAAAGARIYSAAAAARPLENAYLELVRKGE